LDDTLEGALGLWPGESRGSAVVPTTWQPSQKTYTATSRSTYISSRCKSHRLHCSFFRFPAQLLVKCKTCPFFRVLFPVSDHRTSAGGPSDPLSSGGVGPGPAFSWRWPNCPRYYMKVFACTPEGRLTLEAMQVRA